MISAIKYYREVKNIEFKKQAMHFQSSNHCITEGGGQVTTVLKFNGFYAFPKWMGFSVQKHILHSLAELGKVIAGVGTTDLVSLRVTLGFLGPLFHSQRATDTRWDQSRKIITNNKKSKLINLVFNIKRVPGKSLY